MKHFPKLHSRGHEALYTSGFQGNSQQRLITMFKSFLVLAAAAAASLVAASDRVSVKGYTADAKGSLDCKFGSGEIPKKCGPLAQPITECATSNPNKTEEICISEIASFAGDCGGCAVNILECL